MNESSADSLRLRQSAHAIEPSQFCKGSRPACRYPLMPSEKSPRDNTSKRIPRGRSPVLAQRATRTAFFCAREHGCQCWLAQQCCLEASTLQLDLVKEPPLVRLP